MEHKVAEVLSALFNKNIRSTDNIEMDSESDWTSFKHIEIITTLEEEFDVFFPPEDIAKLTSQTKLVEKLKEIIL